MQLKKLVIPNLKEFNKKTSMQVMMLARLCKSKFDSGNQSAAKACASVEEVFDCNVCDFKSNWFTGLQVHNKFSHVNINEDYQEKYEESSKYR